MWLPLYSLEYGGRPIALRRSDVNNQRRGQLPLQCSQTELLLLQGGTEHSCKAPGRCIYCCRGQRLCLTMIACQAERQGDSTQHRLIAPQIGAETLLPAKQKAQGDSTQHPIVAHILCHKLLLKHYCLPSRKHREIARSTPL